MLANCPITYVILTFARTVQNGRIVYVLRIKHSGSGQRCLSSTPSGEVKRLLQANSYIQITDKRTHVAAGHTFKSTLTQSVDWMLGAKDS